MIYIDELDSSVPTMKENVERFKKYGKILTKSASNGSEKAKIGQLNDATFIVFYPDGSFDRFENGPGSISYRPGWSGPGFEHVEAKTEDEFEEEVNKVEQLVMGKTKKTPAKKTVKKTVAKGDESQAPKKITRKKVSKSAAWESTLEMVVESSIIEKETKKKSASRKKTLH